MESSNNVTSSQTSMITMNDRTCVSMCRLEHAVCRHTLQSPAQYMEFILAHANKVHTDVPGRWLFKIDIATLASFPNSGNIQVLSVNVFFRESFQIWRKFAVGLLSNGIWEFWWHRWDSYCCQKFLMALELQVYKFNVSAGKFLH